MTSWQHHVTWRMMDPADSGPDTTLGGYFREHNRPPGFEGLDGEPYTVELETEKTPDFANPYEGYLVFPRWAATGLGVVGHVETATLVRGRSRQGVLDELGEIPLVRVKELLDEAILLRRASQPTDSGPTDSGPADSDPAGSGPPDSGP